MAEFLTEAWFDALGAALASLPADEPAAGRAPAPPGSGLAVGQVVTGVPEQAGAAGARDGEVRYTIVLHFDGTASLVRGSTEEADVTLVEDWRTAESVASGAASVPEMLNTGRIKLRGDGRVLLEAGDLLATMAPLVLAALGRTSL